MRRCLTCRGSLLEDALDTATRRRIYGCIMCGRYFHVLPAGKLEETTPSADHLYDSGWRTEPAGSFAPTHGKPGDADYAPHAPLSQRRKRPGAGIGWGNGTIYLRGTRDA
jgi:hypothetical protein